MSAERPFGPFLVRLSLVWLGAMLALGGCGEGNGRPIGQGDGLIAQLTDPTVTTETRLERIMAQAKEGNVAAIPALLEAMKHRSQTAFHLVPDPEHALGYRAAELLHDPSQDHPVERVAAIVALETIGSYVPLPDLLLALDDRDALVANHAARALVRLGNRAGIPVLLANLEQKVVQTETANRILMEISGVDVGLIPDAGWAAKREAIAKWRQWWSDVLASGKNLPLEGRPYAQGRDPQADRRIAFTADMLGQFQFLFHEQARLALRRMGEPALSFLRQAVEEARQAGNVTTRAGVAQVLGGIDSKNSRELLAALLKDANGAVRARAVTSLGELGGEDAVRLLTESLRGPDAVAALLALGRMGGVLAQGAIQQFDPGGDMAASRAKVLAGFEASEGTLEREAVLAMLLGDDMGARNAAHDVLSRVTGSDGGYDPVAGDGDRRAAVERYRKLLP
jgi:HEAT repeat protein